MDKTVKGYTVWLDAFRGLAALVVFLGHVRVIFIESIRKAVEATASPSEVVTAADAASKAPGAMELTTFGHMAVIVFFVLSGYLVGGGAIRALRSGKWSAKGYAAHRLSRLWTVLIPILLLGYLLDHVGVAMAGPGSIYSGPAGQRMVFTTLPEAMTFGNLLLNALFLQEIIGIPFGTNSPLWTLAYEFWFYAAFPFLMLVLAPSTSILRRGIYVMVLVAIGFFVGSQICLFFLLWLLGAGVEILPKRLTAKQARILAPIGSVLFVVSLVLIFKAKQHFMVSDGVEAVIFAILCYVVVHLQHERPRDVIYWAATGLSAVSYTLYVAHAPLNAFVNNLVMPEWKPWPVDLIGLVKFSSVCALVFGLSVVLWWMFERNTPKVRGWMLRLVAVTPSQSVREEGVPACGRDTALLTVHTSQQAPEDV